MPDESSLGFNVGLRWLTTGWEIHDEGTTDDLQVDNAERSRNNIVLGTTDVYVDFSLRTKEGECSIDDVFQT